MNPLGIITLTGSNSLTGLIIGKRIADISVPKNEKKIVIDLTRWSNGIYLLSLTGNSQVIANGKLVVVK